MRRRLPRHVVALGLGLVLAALLCPADVAAEDSSGPRVDLDATGLQSLASTYQESHYSELTLEEKSAVDAELRKLQYLEPFRSSAAQELASSSGMMAATAAAQHVSVTLSAAAVAALPTDPLVVNNFGAVLRFLNENETSITVLRYARTLESKSPLILTNLANSLLEAGEDQEAENTYRAALAADPDFSQAHQGLGVLYLKRKDGNKALGEFFKAAQTGFLPSYRDGVQQAKANGGSLQDSYRPDRNSSGSTSARLVIPPLASWGNKEALVAAMPELKKYSERLRQEGNKGAPLLLSGTTGYAPGSEPAMTSSRVLRATPLQAIHQRKIFALQLLSEYYADRVREVFTRYDQQVTAIDDDYMQAIGKLAEKYPPRILERLEAFDYNGGNALAVEFHEAVDQAACANFEAWQPLTLNAYNETKMLAEEYWLYSDTLVQGIWDQETLDYVDDMRSAFVNGALTPVVTSMVYRPFVWAAGEILAPPVKKRFFPPEPPPIREPSVPKKPKDKCPFEGGKFKGGAGPVGISVDCESIEVEFTEGVAGALKWNFKNKEGTIFVGAGVGGNVGVVGHSMKAGMTLSFDRDGNFTDAGFSSEVSAGVNLGPASGGVNMNTSMGLVAAVDSSLVLETGVGVK